MPPEKNAQGRCLVGVVVFQGNIMRLNRFLIISHPLPIRIGYGPGLLLVLSLFFFLSPCQAQPVGSLPFEQAVNSALESNPKILAAKATLDATREKHEQGLAALFPDISFNASHTRFSDTWTDTSNATPPDRFNLNLILPVFRQPLLLALRQTKPLIAAAEEDYHATVQAVLLETIQAMVTVEMTANMEKLSADNLVLSHRNREAALARRQAGDLTRTDLDQATARVASAEAELIRAKNDAMVALARFEETVGMEVPRGLTIPDVPPHLLKGTLADLSAQQYHRPDWRAARQRLESADVGVEMERAGHLPFIDLQANAVTFRGGNDPTINGENQYSVAVQLTVPLYSGGKIFSRTREALDTRTAREADLQRVEKQALREIKQAYLSMHSAKATVISAEAAFQFYHEAVKGVEEEFAAGFRTVTQLFELQNQLFRSETDLAKNRHELISSQYQLFSTFGRRTQEELQTTGTEEANRSTDHHPSEADGSNLFTRLINSLRKEPATDQTSTHLQPDEATRMGPLHGAQSRSPEPGHLQWTRKLHAQKPDTPSVGPLQMVDLPGEILDLSMTRRISSSPGGF